MALISSLGIGSGLDLNGLLDQLESSECQKLVPIVRQQKSYSSLEDIRDGINAKNGGVQASLVNDGSDTPYRLVLASRETGTESAISSVNFGGIGLGIDASAGTEAQDASLKVNGIVITSQSNQVEGAIQGVTLDLTEAGADATATLNIKRDDTGIEKAVTDFVEAYNTLQGNISNLTRFDAKTGSAGELLGNATLRSVESRLRNVMGSGTQGELSSLSDIGVSLKMDGKLELDKEKLGKMVAEQPAALRQFFAGESTGENAGEGTGIEGVAGVKSGFAGSVDKALSLILEDKGLLDNATAGLENRIESLSERYARTEKVSMQLLPAIALSFLSSMA